MRFCHLLGSAFGSQKVKIQQPEDQRARTEAKLIELCEMLELKRAGVYGTAEEHALEIAETPVIKTCSCLYVARAEEMINKPCAVLVSVC
jgi:Na+-translocating ferredoxin:NAD+ oxidoreductase RnfC subunit